jgi:outer membrane protein assembly factor BamB
MVLASALAVAVQTGMAAAHGSGFAGGAGAGGSGMAGAGMLTVADDGSLLVTEMGAGGMMAGPFGEIDRELVNVRADGSVRWRVSFDDGVPMMPVTAGDLVIFALRDDWWIGIDASGDTGWGHGGGPGGGPMHDGGDAHADTATVVALDLYTGEELWRYEVDGDMIVIPQISPDGSRVYLTTRDLSGSVGLGGGPMHQGGAPSASMLMSTTVIALDVATGDQLWSVALEESR